MQGPVLLLVAASAVLALLALAAWMRHRTLMSSPGAFDGVVVGEGGRRRRVVGRYGEDLLGLAPTPWTEPRPPFTLETSVPGVFAAGDVRLDSMKRVASAVGEGAMSVYLVHRYLATT